MAKLRLWYWLIAPSVLVGGAVCVVHASGYFAPDPGSFNHLNSHAKQALAKQTPRPNMPREFEPEQQSFDWHRSGIQKALKGDYVNAIADYNQALNLSPHNPEIYYNRAVAHYSVGQPQIALQDLDRALQLQPTMAEAYANRGSIHLEMGNQDGAIADGQKAIALFEQQGEHQLAANLRHWLHLNTSVTDF